VLEFNNNAWDHVMLNGAHPLGVNSVSWAPSLHAGSLVSASGSNDKSAVRRFVSGGSDCLIKIWDWR
jgi:protein transport protein SEC13